MLNQFPIRHYDFGVIDRWHASVVRAIEEDIEVGQMTITVALSADKPAVLKTIVLSSDGDIWYDVEIIRTAEGMQVGCRCRAGENCTPCKHIAAVLLVKKWIPRPAGVNPNPRLKLNRTLFLDDPIIAAVRPPKDDA